jgi:hypothetical protein
MTFTAVLLPLVTCSLTLSRISAEQVDLWKCAKDHRYNEPKSAGEIKNWPNMHKNRATKYVGKKLRFYRQIEPNNASKNERNQPTYLW